jgi:hypothetical protein
VLDHWLRDAENKAKLPKLNGGLWHPYRRAWATSRKHLPTDPQTGPALPFTQIQLPKQCRNMTYKMDPQTDP